MRMTRSSDTGPSMVQPHAVDTPASTAGRRPAGRASRARQTWAICSMACSGVMLMFALLCSRDAEIGIVSLCAPAANARSAPFRLGTSATTVRPGILIASATTSAVSAICGSSFGDTKEPTSISRRPASARARIQRCFAAVGMMRLTLCRPSRGPTSLTRTSGTVALVGMGSSCWRKPLFCYLI